MPLDDSFLLTQLTVDFVDGPRSRATLIMEPDDIRGRGLDVTFLNVRRPVDMTDADVFLWWQHDDAPALRGLEPFTPIDASIGHFKVYYPPAMGLSKGTVTAKIMVGEDEHAPAIPLPKINVTATVADPNASPKEDTFSVLADLLVTYREGLVDLEVEIEKAEDVIDRANEVTGNVEANENERVEAESQRKASEQEREEAEEARQSAESSRVEAETKREEAEQARSDAETARAAAEDLRDQAETAREAAEQARAEAESLRDTAEQTRDQAETQRAQAESERKEAEQKRVDAEASRVGAETERETAETAREEAETARAEAEKLRDQAEQARDAAEQARIAAEELRDQAEKDRQAAESARSVSEEARAGAEAERETAEQEREKAEQKRAAAEEARAEADEKWTQAEAAREAAEGERADAEAKREEAEAKREEAEGERATAEQARDTAETERQEFFEATKAQVEAGDFNGATFIPTVSEEGDISWTNDKELPNPETRNIRGPQGEGLANKGAYDSFEAFQEAHPEGTSPGDSYLVGGSYYVWDGSEWKDQGPIRGEKGDPGENATTTELASEEAPGLLRQLTGREDHVLLGTGEWGRYMGGGGGSAGPMWLEVDEAGDLYAYYDDGSSAPALEYDEADGNLYAIFVTED